MEATIDELDKLYVSNGGGVALAVEWRRRSAWRLFEVRLPTEASCQPKVLQIH